MDQNLRLYPQEAKRDEVPSRNNSADLPHDQEPRLPAATERGTAEEPRQQTDQSAAAVLCHG